MDCEGFEFGPFDVNFRSGELRCGDQVSQLHEKPMRLLRVLLLNAGRVVLREELHEELWPDDLHVDFDNNLNAAVRKLRDILGDSVKSPTYIETIPRKGYRFIGKVSPMSNLSRVSMPTSSSVMRKERKSLGLALVLGILALIWMARSVRKPQKATLPSSGTVMLAVLPFENATGDPSNLFLSDGLCEALIFHLGRISPDRLRVIARISAMNYRETNLSLSEVAADLKADFLLGGKLIAGKDSLRLSLDLVQVKDQSQLWSETFNFTYQELMDLQDRISTQVANTMAIELLDGDPSARARAGTISSDAYLHYIRGRFSWNQFNQAGYRDAIDHFQSALINDPEYALAYAGLADAYNLLAFTDRSIQRHSFEQAKSNARQALLLDHECAEAHNSLAFALLYQDRNFVEAERHFLRAIHLSPGYAMSYHWFAGLLSVTQRHQEAIDALDKALELDPVSLSVRSDLGWYYLFADQDQQAEHAFRQTLEQEPNYGWAKLGLSQSLLNMKRYGELRDFILDGLPADVTETYPFLMDDPQPAISKWFEQGMKQLVNEETPQALDCAIACAQAGELDEAMAWLEIANSADDTWLVFLRVDPRFDVLHGLNRFEQLADILGLPHASEDRKRM